MFDLTGKVALVTGAAHGLGKGIAICLAKAGAHVVINDICEPKEAEDALSQVETAEKPADFMQADVSEPGIGITQLRDFLIIQSCPDRSAFPRCLR